MPSVPPSGGPTDPNGNPEKPIAAWRLPQETVNAIRELKRSIDELKNVTVEQLEKENITGLKKGNEESQKRAGSGGNASTAPVSSRPEAGETSPYKSAAAISPLDYLKEGLKAKANKKPFTQGALIQAKEGVGANASLPPSGPIPGMNQKELNEAVNQKMKIPQFGDYQLDNYFELMRDFALRKAAKAPGTEYDEEGNVTKFGNQTMANIGANLNYMASRASQVKALQNLQRFVTRKGEEHLAPGESLGYSPNTGSFGELSSSHILGQPNPLSWFTSEAGQESMGMNLGALGMALTGNLSFGQAGAVYNAAAEQGFHDSESGFLGFKTGGAMTNVATRFLQPLAEKGISPEIAAPFTEQLKTGTIGIQELYQSISKLGEISGVTQKTVAQTAESLAQYSQVAVAHGGTPGLAYQTGMQYSAITGLGPSSAGSSMESSPYFQALALSHGVLPTSLGSLSASSISGMQLQGLEQIASLMPGGKNVGPHGEITWSQQAIDYAASKMGMTTAEAEQLLRHKPEIHEAARVNPWMEANQKKYSQFKGEDHGKGMTLAQRHILGQNEIKILHELKHGSDHFSQGEIEEYANAGQGQKKAILEKMESKKAKISPSNEQGTKNVLIGLAPDAKKLLKIESGIPRYQEEANAGGGSTAQKAVGVLVAVAGVGLDAAGVL